MLGQESLKKLDQVRAQRIAIIKKIKTEVEKDFPCFKFENISDKDSPFFWPITYKNQSAGHSKIDVAKVLIAEGIDLNPDYKYLVSDWPWIQQYLTGNKDTPKAMATIQNSFNLLFHEGFHEDDIQDIISAFKKVGKTLEH